MMNVIEKEIAYIYVIVDSNTSSVKVGVSNNPNRRLKQLQTGHPNELKLYFTEEFECTRNHLLKIEKLLHLEIGKQYHKLKGEWFTVEENQLNSLKNIIAWFRIRYEDDELYFKYR